MPNETGSTQPENESEEEARKAKETKAAEDGAGGDGAGDGGKEKESPYQKQLDEMKAREDAAIKAKEAAEEDARKKDEIIEHKNRALEAEKKKGALSGEDLKKELLHEVEQKFIANKFEDYLVKFTGDTVERDVLRKIYATQVVKSGDLDKDFRTAVAIANQNVVWEQRENKAREEQNENFLVGFQSTNVRGESDSRFPGQVEREAEKILEALNPKAKEHLKKQFK